MDLSNQTEIDLLVQTAWNDYQSGNQAALDKILEHLMPFGLRVCAKTCGRYINKDDEEAGVAMLAILEALEKYDPAQGPFLVFSGQVIRNRIIDYKRKEKKQSLLPLAFLNRNSSYLADKVDNHFFEDIIDDLARKQEIEKLNALLLDFDICFEDLVQNSPRQPRSRESAQKIASLIVANQPLSHYMMEKKMLPLKELEDKWQVNRKIADRYRKYIIATVLININDFPYLKSYILPLQGGNKNAI